jgi:hypothetical protein
MAFFDGFSECWWPGTTCHVDWDGAAAVGTWAAVVIALLFALADRYDRRRRDHLEAVVLAQLLLKDFKSTATKLSELQSRVDPDKSGGLFDALLAMDENLRQQVAGELRSIDMPTLSASTARLHALPADLVQQVTRLMQHVDSLARYGRTLADMKQNKARDETDPLMHEIRTGLDHAHARARALVSAVRQFAYRD